MRKKIEIMISGEQGTGKTKVFEIISKALADEGYTGISLLPIPSLKMEDRALFHNTDRDISITFLQTDHETV